MAKHKCIDCAHCNANELLCHPESKDCKAEYKLDPEDLTTPQRCDFFKRKENNANETLC